MIKNIIFDFGNVIGRFDHLECIKNFTNNEEEIKFLDENVINSPEWLKYGHMDSGLVTYDAIIKLINDRTNNIYPELVSNLVNNYYKYITISDDIINIVKELKNKGYNIYLLSNTSDPVINEFKDHEIFKYFDGFVLSCKINMLKPNNGIYEYILNKYNLIPEECLFIDDREDNMATANRFGINGRYVNKDDVEDIKKILKEYNIL
ncbi:MAG: HAD family phosphatase [Bacilli bacterium]|nr:HAD family phosphatase [Bacilli bacterium]